MFHNHRKKRHVDYMYFSMYSVIHSFISHIFITFLVTHTMSNEINDFKWKLELNTRSEAFHQNNYHFDNQTNGSKRNIHTHTCSEIQNRNSEAYEEKLFDNFGHFMSRSIFFVTNVKAHELHFVLQKN